MQFSFMQEGPKTKAQFRNDIIICYNILTSSLNLSCKVGPTYGRRMLRGYVASNGISISERLVRSALPQIAPNQHLLRQTGHIDRTNPCLYRSEYFGQKVHIDQNEKLVMYGVTYVLARDGFSGKIVGAAVMPRKNNLTIYDEVYRRAVLEFGLWDEVRVDYGKEFYLVLYMQEKLREQRGNPDIVPYRQTPSTLNHVIERIWVEMNTRVTYPLKRAIISMNDRNVIDLQSNTVQFCVSTVLIKLAEIGMRRLVASWNAHYISGRGIPNLLQYQRNYTTPIHPAEIATVVDAAAEYRQQGGRLTDPQPFGSDPLEEDSQVVEQREETVLQRIGMSFEGIFNNLIAGNKDPFERVIMLFISVTEELEE